MSTAFGQWDDVLKFRGVVGLGASEVGRRWHAADIASPAVSGENVSRYDMAVRQGGPFPGLTLILFTTVTVFAVAGVGAVDVLRAAVFRGR